MVGQPRWEADQSQWLLEGGRDPAGLPRSDHASARHNFQIVIAETLNSRPRATCLAPPIYRWTISARCASLNLLRTGARFSRHAGLKHCWSLEAAAALLRAPNVVQKVDDAQQCAGRVGHSNVAGVFVTHG